MTRNSHGLRPGEFAPPGIVISLYFNNHAYTVNRVQAVPERVGSTIWVQKIRTAADADRAEAAAADATTVPDTSAAVPDSHMPASVPEPTADSQVKDEAIEPDEPMTAETPAVGDASQVKDEPMPESTNVPASSTELFDMFESNNNPTDPPAQRLSRVRQEGDTWTALSEPAHSTSAAQTQQHTIATPRDNNESEVPGSADSSQFETQLKDLFGRPDTEYLLKFARAILDNEFLYLFIQMIKVFNTQKKIKDLSHHGFATIPVVQIPNQGNSGLLTFNDIGKITEKNERRQLMNDQYEAKVDCGNKIYLAFWKLIIHSSTLVEYEQFKRMFETMSPKHLPDYLEAFCAYLTPLAKGSSAVWRLRRMIDIVLSMLMDSTSNDDYFAPESELWRRGPNYHAPSDQYMWKHAGDLPTIPGHFHSHLFRGKSCNTVSNTEDQFDPRTPASSGPPTPKPLPSRFLPYLNRRVQISANPKTTKSSQADKEPLKTSRKSTKTKTPLHHLLAFLQPLRTSLRSRRHHP